jgi:hypothetical protein
MPAQRSEEELAVTFVDLLVPGSFDAARGMVHASCEYHVGGEILRGEGIVASFEASHERASRELDRIEYLPARAIASAEGTVIVHVFDRLELAGAIHTYSDRLAVSVDAEQPRPIVRIEHQPFPEERTALAAFLAQRRRG